MLEGSTGSRVPAFGSRPQVLDEPSREQQGAGQEPAGRRPARALVEGGDTAWLDEETLLVGIGYRTNPAAAHALEEAFPGVEVVLFDLPHWNGRGEVMHLMSFISPLDRDLALVYTRIAPVRLLALLAERGIEVVHVPEVVRVRAFALELASAQRTARDGLLHHALVPADCHVVPSAGDLPT